MVDDPGRRMGHAAAKANAGEDSGGAGARAGQAFEELARALAAGEGCLDVRPAADFASAHLPGSASIPWSELPLRRHELPPRATPFLVAGDGPEQAREAAAWLRDRGWSAALPLEAPLSRWPGPWESGPPTRALWRPSALVRRWAPRLPDGPVLDLGCGAGRDAVYLALRGHPVVGIDRLPDALARAAALARRHGVQLRLLAADLRGSPPHLPADIAPAPGEVPAPAEARASRKARPPLRFAAVLMIRFFAAHLGAWIAERLLPDGLLLLEGPAPEEVERGRLRRVSRTLSPAAAPAAFPGWTVLESTTERDEEQLVLTRLVLRREPAPGLDAGGDGGDPRPKTGGGTPRPEGRRR